MLGIEPPEISAYPSADNLNLCANDGDASEDITYHFAFESEIRNPNTFLYNIGPFSSTGDANLNVHQTYTVTRVDDFGTSTLASGLDVAPINVGHAIVLHAPMDHLTSDGTRSSSTDFIQVLRMGMTLVNVINIFHGQATGVLLREINA